jgi:hypothetical protein
MIAELSARHALPREVVDNVAARTGGVPLFVEEPAHCDFPKKSRGGHLRVSTGPANDKTVRQCGFRAAA